MTHSPRLVRLAALVGIRGAGRVMRDFATYLPTQIVPAMAGFLVLPLLARYLPPSDLGVLALAQTLVSMGWIVVASWLGGAINRELPAHRARGTLDTVAATLRRAVLVVLILLAVFAALVAAFDATTGVIRGATALVVLATLGLVLQNIAGSLLASSLRPGAYVAVDASARTGGIVLGILLVRANHGVEGYLAGLATASIVVGLVGLLLSWPRATPATTGTRPSPDAGCRFRRSSMSSRQTR